MGFRVGSINVIWFRVWLKCLMIFLISLNSNTNFQILCGYRKRSLSLCGFRYKKFKLWSFRKTFTLFCIWSTLREDVVRYETFEGI